MPTTEPLHPDDYGQVYVSSPEGIRAVVTDRDICAQYDVFRDAPPVEGGQANSVRIDRGGHLSWKLGDLGRLPVIELDSAYDYTALGWILTARDGALHFTSSTTGTAGTITPSGVTLT